MSRTPSPRSARRRCSRCEAAARAGAARARACGLAGTPGPSRRAHPPCRPPRPRCARARRACEQAQASQMAKMTQAGSAAAADASAQSAQVFKEPFFKVLKGEGPLSNYAWFRNYHAKYFVPGRLAPLTHICLFLGCLGYSMEYAYHLQCARVRGAAWTRARPTRRAGARAPGPAPRARGPAACAAAPSGRVGGHGARRGARGARAALTRAVRHRAPPSPGAQTSATACATRTATRRRAAPACLPERAHGAAGRQQRQRPATSPSHGAAVAPRRQAPPRGGAWARQWRRNRRGSGARARAVCLRLATLRAAAGSACRTVESVHDAAADRGAGRS